VVETCETEKVTKVINLHHEVVFDLATRPAHLTDWMFDPGSLRYGTYVGFAKPKSIPREVAIPVSPHAPMWQQFISLASALGVQAERWPDCVVETSDLSKRYAEMLLNLDHDLPLVCVAPGTAGDSLKRWPSEYFAACIRVIHTTRPCHVVLLGEQFEKDIGDAIAARVGFEIDNLMGLTTLGCFVHILKQSRLVVANDNGAMHLGGLMNTPTVGLFGPSDPEHYHPLGAKSAVLASVSGDIADIDPASVAAECLRLLELEHA
jgi:ADP-heptose:LPS heptosyltransferase